MIKILLTGSRGMVGRNILDNSKSSDYIFLDPSRHELDLLDINLVNKFISDQKIITLYFQCRSLKFISHQETQ